ncbi:aspartic proteinase 36-like isoform X1 [Vicia villosa]|uniref:aspartic proteinase 36-like isoform X1 n=2 Tax=Vicia villosa TaxID=3911 RepID=UPI00273BBF02|nr:aspartic proteinase 36-like isoform X1 [Vicia villosa]XP_058742956.1 aspartic proteinase 36-like isoform X1 [Vicia villosa]
MDKENGSSQKAEDFKLKKKRKREREKNMLRKKRRKLEAAREMLEDGEQNKSFKSKSRPHYNLNLLSISVSGQVLPIDSAIFATSNNRGTIIDSGTTLAYIAEEAYNPFINAITAAIPQSVRTVLSRGNQCYLVTTSLDMFPQVSLNFAGGASLVLGPQDYLIKQNYIGDGSVWCIGFQKIPGQDVTILGGRVKEAYGRGGRQLT